MAFEPNTSSEFIAWIEHRPGAFYINVDTSGPRQSILHRAQCWHIYPPTSGRNFLSYRKICAEDRDDLLRWAQRHNQTLTDCRSCKP